MNARDPACNAIATLHRHAVRWRWAYAVALSAVIFHLSSIPIRLPRGITHLDKLGHLAAYVMLGAAYFNAITRGGLRLTGARAGLAFLLASAYGASDEWHQSFVPGRKAEALDWLADSVGAALATAGAWLLARRIPPRTG